MMRRFKNEGFFLVQEAEKNKKLEMHKSDQKSSKKKIKNTWTQKEGKMEQEKTCVQRRKIKENKLKKGKEK